MTKSIEEQRENLAEKYVSLSSPEMTRLQMAWDFKNGFDSGAKARDAQFMLVVNELREALKKTKSISVDMQESDMNNCCSTYSKSDFEFIADKSLIKADQMLKEMKL